MTITNQTNPVGSSYTSKKSYIAVPREGNIFIVKGRQAERAVALNDLTNIEALEYIQFTLEKIGVNKALRKAGIREGDYVQIGELQFDYMDDDEHWID